MIESGKEITMTTQHNSSYFPDLVDPAVESCRNSRWGCPTCIHDDSQSCVDMARYAPFIVVTENRTLYQSCRHHRENCSFGQTEPAMIKRSDFWGFTIGRFEVCFYKRQLIVIAYTQKRKGYNPPHTIYILDRKPSY